MIEMREGISPAFADRLIEYAATCPYYEQKRYFETTLAVARIASRRAQAARDILMSISARPGIDVEERAALRLINAHAEAVLGHLTAARQSVVAAIVPFEEFRLRRLRNAVEQRIAVGSAPEQTRSDNIGTLDNNLVRLEMDCLIDRALSDTRRIARAA